jgi:two-component system, sensor histidine kinase and response regulator
MGALWDAASAGRPYPLVLLDARMPDTDGLAVAAQIRERSALSATRIILLSSGDRPGDPARSRDLRIDARLLKPVQQSELLETIYKVMNRTNGDTAMAVAEVALEPARISVPISAQLNILVAEDNEFIAQLMERLVLGRGHRLRLVTNGREALALAEAETFDLLLLDVHMPEMDGFQVIRALRAREKETGRHLPVIALTARSRKEDRERCLAAGMDDFLTKPVSAAELFAAIERLMSTPEISRPAEEATGAHGNLLDPVAILAACGDDAEGLRRMSESFQTYAPIQLAELCAALRDGDSPRLCAAAHKICPLLLAFSTVAGNVASDLEDLAAEGQLEKTQPLVEQLETMVQELMPLINGLSMETLRSGSDVSR